MFEVEAEADATFAVGHGSEDDSMVNCKKEQKTRKSVGMKRGVSWLLPNTVLKVVSP